MHLILVTFYFLATGCISLFLGQDFNFDLLNYHFYNPYQFIYQRLESDILAAQLQTFINPLIDLPFFVLVHLVGVFPFVVGFFWGGIHGLNLYLVHCGLWYSLKNINFKTRHLICFSGALTSLLGAGFFSEIGTTMGDNTISLFVLSSLILFTLTFYRYSKIQIRTVLGSGVLFGLGLGFKLTIMPMAVGLTGAIFAVSEGAQNKIRNTIGFILTSAVSASLTGGYWMVLLFRKFGNPVFPFFNDIFKSAWAPLIRMSDERFLPKDSWQALFYPFYFVMERFPAAECNFKDGRFATVYTLIVVFLVTAIVSHSKKFHRPAREAFINSDVLRFFVLFVIISYSVWQYQFSIYRYAIPIELITPILISLLIGSICSSERQMLFAFLLTIFIVNVTTKHEYWGRQSWSWNYFGVRKEELNKYQNSAFLLLEQDPNSYLIPHFPKSNKFVRVQVPSNEVQSDYFEKLRGKDKVIALIKKSDAIYVLYDQRNFDKSVIDQELLQYHIAPSSNPCEELVSRISRYRICPLERQVAFQNNDR